MGEPNGKHNGHHVGAKLRHPFHELKEKLHHTHLSDAKVHLIHQKCVRDLVT